MGAIDLEKQKKIEIAANFEFKAGFDPLEQLFEQRKQLARTMRIQIVTEEMEDVFEFYNKTIKQYLGL